MDIEKDKLYYPNCGSSQLETKKGLGTGKTLSSFHIS